MPATDIIYRPTGQYHQLFNPADGWLQHHVINMPVDGDGGQFVKRNWRNRPPLSDGEGAVRWHLLGPEKEQDGGCLRGLSFIDREMAQPRRRSAEKNAQDLEQIDYVLAGAGTLICNGHEKLSVKATPFICGRRRPTTLPMPERRG